MQNIKLILGYDGSGYHGFQIQENAKTVQETLEQAMAVVLGAAIRVTPAGRTDAGVHAEGQVVNARLATRIPVARLPYAFNTGLPDDIVVWQAEPVPDSFHARISAVSKIYTYTIDNAPHPRVLTRKYAYHVRQPLDAALMAASAASLVGVQDFASFCASGSTVKSTVRRLLRLEVAEQDCYIKITAEANGFLYNMVRIIAGTLIEVGSGRRPPELGSVLAARDRCAAGYTVPPQGLVLKCVKY